MWLISGGLGLQRLEAGFWFPASDWGRVAAVRAPNLRHCQWKARALRLCRKSIPAKMESGETSINLEKKVQYLWIDTRAGAERVAPWWQFKSLICGIFSRFPLANHFDLPDSKSEFGIAQDFPMCACTSLSQDGFYRRGLWVDLATWHHSPFDLQGGFLRMCSWGGLLTSGMRNMWSLIFYLGRAQPPLSIVLLFPSGSIGPQGTNSNRLPQGPICLLPQSNSFKLSESQFSSFEKWG